MREKLPVSGLVDGLMVENVVSVREGSTLDVLAGQTDMNALFQQGAEGHGLAQGPVHDTVLDHLHTSLQNTLNT